MFNNPYMNPFANFPQNYPQFPQQEKQQPITQNFQLTNSPVGSEYFMAKILKANETAETQFVTQKTAFIDLQNKKLSIKEVDGEIKSYQIILPLDEKDKKIQELENQINELKGMMENEPISNVTTNNESTEQNANVKKFGRK